MKVNIYEMTLHELNVEAKWHKRFLKELRRLIRQKTKRSGMTTNRKAAK